MLGGTVRQWLIENIDGGLASTLAAPETPAEDSSSEEDDDGNRKMRLRRRGTTSYKIEDNDHAYFAQLEQGNEAMPQGARGRMQKQRTAVEIGRDFTKRQAGM